MLIGGIGQQGAALSVGDGHPGGQGVEHGRQQPLFLLDPGLGLGQGRGLLAQERIGLLAVGDVVDNGKQQRLPGDLDGAGEHLHRTDGAVGAAVGELEMIVPRGSGLRHGGVQFLGRQGVDLVDAHLPQVLPRPAVKARRRLVGVDDPAAVRIDEQADGRVVVEQAAKKGGAGQHCLFNLARCPGLRGNRVRGWGVGRGGLFVRACHRGPPGTSATAGSEIWPKVDTNVGRPARGFLSIGAGTAGFTRRVAQGGGAGWGEVGWDSGQGGGLGGKGVEQGAEELFVVLQALAQDRFQVGHLPVVDDQVGAEGQGLQVVEGVQPGTDDGVEGEPSSAGRELADGAVEVGKGPVRLAQHQVVVGDPQEFQSLVRAQGQVHPVAHALQGVHGLDAPLVGHDGHQGRGDVGGAGGVARVLAVGEPVLVRRRRGEALRLLCTGGGGEEIGEEIKRAFSCETALLHGLLDRL